MTFRLKCWLIFFTLTAAHVRLLPTGTCHTDMFLLHHVLEPTKSLYH